MLNKHQAVKSVLLRFNIPQFRQVLHSKDCSVLYWSCHIKQAQKSP